MNDGEALRRAVGAAPRDDTPRLVYADWLDEHGRPERARLIRLQCEREALPDWDARAVEIDEQLTALGLNLQDDSFTHARVFEMVRDDLPDEATQNAFARVWSNSSSGNITNPTGLPRVRRGFFDYVRLDDENCTDQLEQLPALTPVTAVRLRGRVGASAETVGRLPPHLRRLEVAPYLPEEADFRGLLAHPLPALAELSLEAPYGWRGAPLDALTWDLRPVLARAWDSLLLDFPLTTRAIGRLAGCLGTVRGLTLFNVRGSGYHRLFRGAWAERVERVRLRQYGDDHRATANGLGDLLGTLGRLPNLRALDLRNFRLTPEGWGAFVRAGGFTRAEEVTVGGVGLGGAALGPEWLRQLADAKRPTALRRLNLPNAGFSDEHARELARGVHPHLVWLDLTHLHSPPDAGMTAAGVAALARSPLRGQLRALNLYNHPLGDAGLCALSADEWPELRLLDVRGPATQDAVADVLFRARCPNLVRLEIGCQGSTSRLARALGDAGPADSPFTLYLTTPFDDGDVPALLRSRYLRSLRRFWLAYPRFTDPGKERLRGHFGSQLKLY